MPPPRAAYRSRWPRRIHKQSGPFVTIAAGWRRSKATSREGAAPAHPGRAPGQTRAALLDATIDCLVEEGYAGTTTTRIVERAGVSRGAQVHHFPTKGELVAEAVRHLAERRAEEFLAEAREVPARGRRRFERMLDLLWRIHIGPLFAASVELWVAARADDDLRLRSSRSSARSRRSPRTGIDDLFPEMAGVRAFREAVDASLATMRGLALLRLRQRRAGDGAPLGGCPPNAGRGCRRASHLGIDFRRRAAVPRSPRRSGGDMAELGCDRPGGRAAVAASSVPPIPTTTTLRKVFNAMVDRRPEAIAGARPASDVAAAIRFARRDGLPNRRLRRWPLGHRPRRLRRRAGHRPPADGGVRGGSRGEDRPRRRGSDLGSRRRCHPGARPGGHRRPGARHRRRRPHARQRLRLDRAQVRPHLRQPALGRDRHRRR